MFVQPDWSLPNNVKALYTNRKGGVSNAPYVSFNLATHVNDDLQKVLQNRQTLITQAALPQAPFWLEQQHTDVVVLVKTDSDNSAPPVADASFTNDRGVVLCVMTADCLPILIANKQGSEVAAVHAGWRGLAQGIIGKTIQKMHSQPKDLTVWIGPAISQPFFEVGQEVKAEFLRVNPEYAKAFIDSKEQNNKCFADLPTIAAMELNNLGVHQVTKSGLCSYAEKEEFFSYRRDGQTGRMASLIWIE